MRPPEILWAIGIALAVTGELWGVFSRAEGDTITEWTFRHPLSLMVMTSLVFWAVWHFVFAQGRARWWDLLVVAVGMLAGLLAWIFNRPKQKPKDV